MDVFLITDKNLKGIGITSEKDNLDRCWHPFWTGA